LAVLLLAVGPAWTQEKAATDKPKGGAKADKPKSALKGEYLIMTSDAAGLKLTDEQKKKMEDAAKAYQDALDAWTKEKGKKLEELQKALSELRKAEKKDEEKIKAANAEVKPLVEERDKLREKLQADIMAILTDEQKAAWTAFKLYTTQCNKYRKAELTDEQKAKVKDLCVTTVKEMGDGKDKKVVNEAQKKLDAAIQALLTAEQKAKMEKKADTPPKAGATKEGTKTGETKAPESK
jgi:Spy/CpxP family protein refolding chaperone